MHAHTLAQSKNGFKATLGLRGEQLSPSPYLDLVNDSDAEVLPISRLSELVVPRPPSLPTAVSTCAPTNSGHTSRHSVQSCLDCYKCLQVAHRPMTTLTVCAFIVAES